MKASIEDATGGAKARVRYPNGRTRSKTVGTQREVKAWLRRTLTEIRVGTFVPDSSGKITLAPWVERWLPLPRQSVEALETHVERYDIGRDDRVFTSAKGHILRAYQSRRRYFQPAGERAGLGAVRPHDLRHSAVSLWIASDANPKVVQTRVGHSSIKVTYDRYGHLFPDYDDRTTRHLEQRWADAQDDAQNDNVVRLTERARRR